MSLICHDLHKILTNSSFYRQTLWFLLYGIASVVVQAQFSAKRKAVIVTVGKNSQVMKRG